MARSRSRKFADLIGKDSIVDSGNALVGGGAVTTYSSIDALPLSGNDAGDQAFVSENNRLYIWTGDGWYNIALVNTDPSIQANSYSSSYELSTEGTATTVTLIASDPEGVPITWTYANSGLGSIATITQSNNVFTITPTANAELGGTFSVTFKASDGVNLASATSEFTLSFSTTVENSNYTTTLITSIGTNGATNSTVTDSSTNNHTVTVNNDASSQTFSPYRSGGYSYYFDGAGDWLVIPGSSDFGYGTGNFTIEFWAYLNSHKNYNELFDQRTSTQDAYTASIMLYTDSSGNIHFLHSGSNRITATMPVREWVHIALSRSGTSTKMFLNGVQAGSTYSDSTNYLTPASNWSIGGSLQQNNYSMDGYISDVRVVKGTAVYTTDFTPPTERLEAITNTSLLTCHLPYVKDGSTNDHSITVNGNVSAKPFGPYDYSEYDSATHGGSILFDASGNHITYSPGSTTSFGTGDFTIECWFYRTGIPGNGYHDIIFSNRASGASNPSGSFGLYVQPTDGASFGWQNTTSGTNNLTGGACYLNRWYHMAIVRSGTTLTLYVNGTSVNSSTMSDSIGNTNTCCVGAFVDGSYRSNGYVTDLRVVNGTAVYTSDFTPPTEPLTAISGTELLISGTDASIIDKSQSTQLTLVGDTQSSTTQTKYGSSSMYFDGSGDYIYAPSSTNTDLGVADFTIEFWAKTDSGGTTFRVVTIGDAGTSTGCMFYVYSGRIRLWANAGFANTTDITSVVSNWSSDAWHHYAYCRSGSTLKGFVDGQECESFTFTKDLSGVLHIGAYYYSGSVYSVYPAGYLEDVRITKGLARYTANFTPPTAALEG